MFCFSFLYLNIAPLILGRDLETKPSGIKKPRKSELFQLSKRRKSPSNLKIAYSK